MEEACRQLRWAPESHVHSGQRSMSSHSLTVLCPQVDTHPHPSPSRRLPSSRRYPTGAGSHLPSRSPGVLSAPAVTHTQVCLNLPSEPPPPRLKGAGWCAGAWAGPAAFLGQRQAEPQRCHFPGVPGSLQHLSKKTSPPSSSRPALAPRVRVHIGCPGTAARTVQHSHPGPACCAPPCVPQLVIQTQSL